MDLPARYLRTTTYLGLALFAYNYSFPLEKVPIPPLPPACTAASGPANGPHHRARCSCL